ncbi:MAG: gliding motility-associated ABC transporter substrate-binding protein GldG [Chitinophagaceae bacterium]|nr:gliding motility-associated ABC transporter substrate-binding protein GldG [Chitinophagaceae bacterium]MCZ2397643.1 gliding motility-associated ABC transporter substrate-binding protein GldG [Chitinophagales bacterium]
MNRKKKNILGWIGVIAVLAIFNILSVYIHKRIDLTGDKRFTISEPVRKILKETSDPVTIYLFLKGDLPSGFRMLGQSATELLQEFKDFSKGNVHYKIVSPDEAVPGSTEIWADTLQAMNVLPINLTVQQKAGEESRYVYPAAAVVSAGKIIPVNLYSGTRSVITPNDLNQAESMFEYKFAEAIHKLHQQTKPMVAYAIGNGEPTGAETYDLVEHVLHPNYSVFTLDLEKEEAIPDTFKVLLLVKPSQKFSDEAKLKLDQYVMRGGKLLAFVDRLEAEMDSLQLGSRQVVAYDRNLGLQDLFFRYGVRINPDLIMDLQSDFLPFDVNNSGQFELLHWNYFPLFQPDQHSVVTRNVGLVAGRFANSMDTVKADGIKKTLLLGTSPNSRTIETPALISGAENRNAPVDAAFNRSNIPAAVLLEGKFTSLYRNRLSREQLEGMNAAGSPFVPESTNENKMIVVSDGDIVLNSMYRAQPIPMGVNPFTIGTQYEYQFANRSFVENCLAYLVNDAGLMAAKAKDFKLRLLDSKKVNAQKTVWQILSFVIPALLILLAGGLYQVARNRRFR